MNNRTPFPLPPNPMAASSSAHPLPQVPTAQYGYGAYNPAFAFRQALFPGYQALPQNAAGYSYSSTYQPDQSTPAPSHAASLTPGPPRRPRLQEPGVGPWRNCCQPGCAFTGPDETVSVHEGDRHLIFPKGKPVERSEEEERALKRGGPTPSIQGTSITLQTEADIQAWIAERKARWPSRQRVEQQETEKKDRIARGEVEPSTRGQRGGRGGRGKGGRNDATSRAEDWGRPHIARPDALAASARGRGRGRGRGGVAVSARVAPAAQASDSSSSNSDSSDSSSDSDSNSDSDGAPALPAHIPAPIAAAIVEQPRQKSNRPCKYFLQRGKCRNGDTCHFSHDLQAMPNKTRAQLTRPSLLGSMLQAPIDATLSQLTQTIRFLVANDMLQGVELAVGDAEEREAQRRRITVLEAPPVTEM